jgi:hypothetical protein
MVPASLPMEDGTDSPSAQFNRESTTTTLTDGTETLTFSNTVDARTVPSGGWATSSNASLPLADH